ncbi:hypothetical protein [Legionella tunisiensis]|uniref:hypothetical protein n=1 Tax=Legionella tunisiensis TaxID=1034944 RepID=UPI0003807B5A|nr:hypothetical protein [Legionella tunisiensis]
MLEWQDRAYQNLTISMPNALELLEMARIAAQLDSTLGHSIPCISRLSRNKFKLSYFIDMNDALNENFLEKLREYKGPINHQDLFNKQDEEYFFTPDFKEFAKEFTISKQIFMNFLEDAVTRLTKACLEHPEQYDCIGLYALIMETIEPALFKAVL